MDSAHLASGAIPASAVTSTTAASECRAPDGLTTVGTSRARVGEGRTVGIREVEDIGLQRISADMHYMPSLCQALC